MGTKSFPAGSFTNILVKQSFTHSLHIVIRLAKNSLWQTNHLIINLKNINHLLVFLIVALVSFFVFQAIASLVRETFLHGKHRKDIQINI